MTNFIVPIIFFIIFLLLFLIQVIVKSKAPFKKTIFGIIKGIFALALVNISGIFTGVTLPVSLLSLAIAAVGGIPGVTTLLILDMVL